MARDLQNLFSLVVPTSLQQNAALPAVSKLIAFDDLGDFVEERQRIQRKVESALTTKLKVDFSDFAKHVFFDSALSKFTIAKNKILTEYPFAGNSEEKDLFLLSGSQYENYLFQQWPRFVGGVTLNGTNQYISASDNNGTLFIGSSSLYVSAWVQPNTVSSQNVVLQMLSASTLTSPALKYGYELLVSGTADPYVKFNLYSGSQTVTVSAPFSPLSTGSFNNVAAIYDKPAGLLSLYINADVRASASVAFGPINFNPVSVYIGSGSQYDVSGSTTPYAYYSGSIDEIRVFHTASAAFHKKNYARSVTSEDYVKLYYKFNEGIVGTSSIDNIVADYSRNSLHGQIVNYTSTARFSGSAMAGEVGDPILYSFHSGVMAFTASIETSASIYDATNRSYIFRLLPEDLLIQDQQADGLLISFALAMSRYFDEMKLYIDQFDNLRVTNYQDADESPDLMLPMLKKYFGWKVTDHYSDANPLEFFFGESVLSSGSMTTSLSDIRDEFWRRILNNMPYLFKAKGKRTSLDAFFNVLGLNKHLLNLKEYGFINANSIADTYIYKEKSVPFLGIGTGSLGSPSGSYFSVKSFLTASKAYNEWTIESYAQLPHVSSSYTGSILTGSLWEMVSPTQTQGYALLWNVPSIGSTAVRFILTGSDGQVFATSPVTGTDGHFVHVAAGLQAGTRKPFVEVRVIDRDTFALTSSFVGSTGLSGVFTGSNYDFVMGATSGSLFRYQTQGYFNQYRVWQRQLSASELSAHALDVDNVGIRDPLEQPNPLLAHWGLNENKSTDSAGSINGITDLSRNRFYATGSGFLANSTPYSKLLTGYSYLSPSLDLKWTENKIRIRNKSELLIGDIADDTNEITLEFNLVDSLNEDIVKIFSTFDLLNNAIGQPINKYRDEYDDLESYRRIYFERLSTSLNFTQFFKLFRWYDKKIADSIKQLLPARVNFIGGEFVVESHLLERNKYQYKYPVFKTPKETEVGDIGQLGTNMSGGSVTVTQGGNTPALGTYVRTFMRNEQKYSDIGLNTTPRFASTVIEGVVSPRFISKCSDGDERIDRHKDNFYRRKISGDTEIDISNPNTGVNIRNEYARRLIDENLKNNKDGYRSGTFVHPSLGNGFVVNDIKTVMDDVHYVGSHKKTLPLVVRGFSHPVNLLSGNVATGTDTFQNTNGFTVTGSATITSDTTYAWQGTRSLKLSASANTTLDGFQVQVPCKSVTQYTLSGYFKAESNGSFALSASDDIGMVSASSIPLTTTFTRQQFVFRVSTFAGLLTLKFLEPHSGSGITMWADGLMLRNGSGTSDWVDDFGKTGLDMNQFTVLGDGRIPLSMSLYDSCGTPIETGSFLPANFGIDVNTNEPKWDPVLTYRVSGTNTTFNTNEFQFTFRDWTTSAWSAFTNMNPYGAFFSESNGWMRFESRLVDGGGSVLNPILKFDAGANQFPFLLSASPGKVYTFKDIMLSFNQPLNDYGTSQYRSIDNQNVNKQALYINRNVMPSTPASLSTVSYYGWDRLSVPALGYSRLTTRGVAANSNGHIYLACTGMGPGGTYWLVFKTIDRVNWSVADSYIPVWGRPALQATAAPQFIKVDLSGNIYVVGNSTEYGDDQSGTRVLVRRSIDAGNSWQTVYNTGSSVGNAVEAAGLCIGPDNSVYVATNFNVLAKSVTGASGTFSLANAGIGSCDGGVAVDKSNSLNVYIAGLAVSGSNPSTIYKSTNSGSTWSVVLNLNSATRFFNFIETDLSGTVYAHSARYAVVNTIYSSSDGGTSWGNQAADPTTSISTGPIATWENNIYHLNTTARRLYLSTDRGATWKSIYSAGVPNYLDVNQDKIYLGYGSAQSGSEVRIGSPQSNSASFGARTFATSVGAVLTESNGITQERFHLMNVSEYPHNSGLFQMKNIVLGTRDSGPIGRDENSIVQIKHIGSVVQVMWPSQQNAQAGIRGNVDAGPGHQPGQLATEFTYGDPIDVTQYDHMALYCYLSKYASGTLDDVLVQVERRPLNSVGFAPDQSVEYVTSGSATEAIYRNIYHTKPVDYGDLSIKEVSYTIDVPLTNVRQVRIAVRHKNGQAEANRNLIVWGRFIKSSQET